MHFIAAQVLVSAMSAVAALVNTRCYTEACEHRLNSANLIVQVNNVAVIASYSLGSYALRLSFCVRVYLCVSSFLCVFVIVSIKYADKGTENERESSVSQVAPGTNKLSFLCTPYHVNFWN